MKKAVALSVLVAVVGIPFTASAHGAAAAVALGLASFAVFNQLVFGLFGPWAYPAPYYAPYYATPAVYATSPPVVRYYAAPPISYAAAPAGSAVVPASYTYGAPPATASARPNEVVFAHGKYVLRGDGVTTAYQWVWIPNPPPAPPPAPR